MRSSNDLEIPSKNFRCMNKKVLIFDVIQFRLGGRSVLSCRPYFRPTQTRKNTSI